MLTVAHFTEWIQTGWRISVDVQFGYTARSAIACAEKETVFLLLGKCSMLTLADKHPTVAFKIIWNIFRALSQRLRLTSAQLAEFLKSNTLWYTGCISAWLVLANIIDWCELTSSLALAGSVSTPHQAKVRRFYFGCPWHTFPCRALQSLGRLKALISLN